MLQELHRLENKYDPAMMITCSRMHHLPVVSVMRAVLWHRDALNLLLHLRTGEHGLEDLMNRKNEIPCLQEI